MATSDTRGVSQDRSASPDDKYDESYPDDDDMATHGVESDEEPRSNALMLPTPTR